jgi:hypothetical protein
MYRIPTSEEVFGELLNHLFLAREPDEREAFVRLPSLAWIPGLLVGTIFLSQQNSI